MVEKTESQKLIEENCDNAMTAVQVSLRVYGRRNGIWWGGWRTKGLREGVSEAIKTKPRLEETCYTDKRDGGE